MSDECYKCGQDGPECNCYLHEIAKRVEDLEDGMYQLTIIVKAISDHVRGKTE